MIPYFNIKTTKQQLQKQESLFRTYLRNLQSTQVLASPIPQRIEKMRFSETISEGLRRWEERAGNPLQPLFELIKGDYEITRQIVNPGEKWKEVRTAHNRILGLAKALFPQISPGAFKNSNYGKVSYSYGTALIENYGPTEEDLMVELRTWPRYKFQPYDATKKVLEELKLRPMTEVVFLGYPFTVKDGFVMELYNTRMVSLLGYPNGDYFISKQGQYAIVGRKHFTPDLLTGEMEAFYVEIEPFQAKSNKFPVTQLSLLELYDMLALEYGRKFKPPIGEWGQEGKFSLTLEQISDSVDFYSDILLNPQNMEQVEDLIPTFDAGASSELFEIPLDFASNDDRMIRDQINRRTPPTFPDLDDSRLRGLIDFLRALDPSTFWPFSQDELKTIYIQTELETEWDKITDLSKKLQDFVIQIDRDSIMKNSPYLSEFLQFLEKGGYLYKVK
jgi:hypothetical protein